MRKVLLLAFSSFCGMVSLARPVSEQEALRYAQEYLAQRQHLLEVHPGSSALTLAYWCTAKASRGVQSATSLYYVFNRAGAGGFVVVAGDDRMKPVVGHTDRGTFVREEVNPALQWWLGALEHTMLDIVSRSESAEPSATIFSTSGFASEVRPLVTTSWGQQAPFNERCPDDVAHKGKSVTGCVATAMSQVLHKWQYPERGAGRVSYSTQRHHISLNEDLSQMVFDWGNMLDEYHGKESAVQRKAVADLMYACGLSVEMDYCSYASGAYLNAFPLEEHFGIDKGCNRILRQYFTTQEWDDLVKTELNAGRPVLYSGYTADAGHTFVCDGYNDTGLFHINWGWDGSQNGYFELAALNSSSESAGQPTDGTSSWNMDQFIVYGIQPAGMPGNIPEVQRIYYALVQAPEGVTAKGKVQMTVQKVESDDNLFRGTIGMGLCDLQGNILEVMAQQNVVLNQNEYFPKVSVTCDFSSVAEGQYYLCPVYKEDGASVFLPARPLLGVGCRSVVPVQVSGSEVSFIDNAADYELDLTVGDVQVRGGQAYAGQTNSLQFEVTNHGAMYNGPVSLVRREGGRLYRVAQNNYVIEAGDTKLIALNAAAPEGVSSDELLVYASEGIDQNGRRIERQIGSFVYELKQSAAGKPVWTVTRFESVHPQNEILQGENLNVRFDVRNDGGFYAGDIYFAVFPDGQTSTDVFTIYRDLVLDKGQSASVELAVQVKDLEPGKYGVAPYYVNSSNQLTAFPGYEYIDQGILFQIVQLDEAVLAAKEQLQQGYEELLQLRQLPFGEEYGEYSGSESQLSQLLSECDRVLQLSPSGLQSMGAGKLNELVQEVDVFVSSVQLVKPQEGHFLTVSTSDKNAGERRYLSSASMSADFLPVPMATGKGANTIFYYTGKQLLAYHTGLFMVSRDGDMGYHGVVSQGETIQFEKAQWAEDRAFNLQAGSARQVLKYTGSAITSTSEPADASCNFSVERVGALPVSISDVRYATLYAPVNLALPAGVEAYVGKENGEYLTLVPVTNVIPAHTAVILIGDAGTYQFTITSAEGIGRDNALKGTVRSLRAEAPVYTLQQLDGEVGLYRYTGDILTGFRAYMPLRAGVSSLRLDLDGSTGIGRVDASADAPVYYDLNGKRVCYPSRGVYVTREGKKVYFK